MCGVALNLDVSECGKNIISAEPTQAQKAVVQSLAERAEKISSGSVSRVEDNMLVVTGDGRKLGLDQRLFNFNLPDEPQSKEDLKRTVNVLTFIMT